MNKKKLIIFGIFILVFLVFLFKVLQEHGIIPQEVGMIIVQDSTNTTSQSTETGGEITGIGIDGSSSGNLYENTLGDSDEDSGIMPTLVPTINGNVTTTDGISTTEGTSTTESTSTTEGSSTTEGTSSTEGNSTTVATSTTEAYSTTEDTPTLNNSSTSNNAVIPTPTPTSDQTPTETLVEMTSQEEAQMFYYEKISQEIKDRITGKSYAVNCKVPYSDLRYVKVLYWGYDEETHTGELIVNKAIAEDIVEIFKELYDHKYPIEKIALVDEYDADDNASMADDNTSAFNYRVVDGTTHLSKHSYGLAIDINPLYNPYVRTIDGKTIITPENGAKYSDRTLECPYYINKNDICYKAFVSRGFIWGGEWKTQKDYQHFEKDLD